MEIVAWLGSQHKPLTVINPRIIIWNLLKKINTSINAIVAEILSQLQWTGIQDKILKKPNSLAGQSVMHLRTFCTKRHINSALSLFF